MDGVFYHSPSFVGVKMNRITPALILATGLFLFSVFNNSWGAEENLRDPQTLKKFTEKAEALLQKKPLQLIKVEALDKDLQIFKSYQLLNLFVLDLQSPLKPLLAHTLLHDGGLRHLRIMKRN
jgi:hypothetical protein